MLTEADRYLRVSYVSLQTGHVPHFSKSIHELYYLGPACQDGKYLASFKTSSRIPRSNSGCVISRYRQYRPDI